ncbi:protein D3-like [Teleopsis dalmanni]|uniref:protein D3-like n=1 Tax=Teleopsis dalmanni TaxID=139649 RepID=UPI0018CDB474|nr:protein D3-like [Teleopsis dalmanni]
MLQIKTFKNALCIFVVIVITLVIALEEDEVQKVFKEHEVVPDVIPNSPNKFLNVTYEDGVVVNKGAELSIDQLTKEPKVDWEADEKAYYTLLMTDPDILNRLRGKSREFPHWVVGNIPGNAVDEGDVLRAYVGTGQPRGTGLHRYVFLVYKQPSKLEFDDRRIGRRNRKNRNHFSVQQFAEKYNLGIPLAGNFMQAKCGNCRSCVTRLFGNYAFFKLQYFVLYVTFFAVINLNL